MTHRPLILNGDLNSEVLPPGEKLDADSLPAQSGGSSTIILEADFSIATGSAGADIAIALPEDNLVDGLHVMVIAYDPDSTNKRASVTSSLKFSEGFGPAFDGPLTGSTQYDFYYQASRNIWIWLQAG